MVHVKLIKSVVASSDLEVIRERIIPLLGVIGDDSEDAICVELCYCLPEIVKAIYEDNADESFSLCSEYLYPLLWNMHVSHVDTVLSISNHHV